MVQPQHNFAPYLQIETKFMMRNKIFFYPFIYFNKSFGKMPITNPVILTVKAGRKLARDRVNAEIVHFYANKIQKMHHRNFNASQDARH